MLNIQTRKEIAAVCEHCHTQLDHIRTLGIFTPELLDTLERPERTLEVNYTIPRDDGNELAIHGWRVQYDSTLGPTKGGIRVHKDSDLEEVTELAFLMTLKTALLGLPLGGAKGAIAIDPHTLSQQEFERVARGFVREIAEHIGPTKDIPAPDVNTNSTVMSWMRDEYEKIVGHNAPAAFTGKPVDHGGSLGRETSTSKGGFYIIEELCAGKKKEDITVAIQGFGNVGSHLAVFLHEAGYRVVAVSDSRTGLYNPEGLPIPELMQHKKSKKPFSERSEDHISNEKLLELPVDILIPSALGGVITKENADAIHAKTIIEMANAPITPEAQDILGSKNTLIVPDILANAGGVVVSYFEWKQNMENAQWNAQEVDEKLKEHMLRAYNRVQETTQKHTTTLRTASYIVALETIFQTNSPAH